jgi:hypothetical protein
MKILFRTICLFFSLLTITNLQAFEKIKLNWTDNTADYFSYMSITGMSGFITTPGAYNKPQGTISLGSDFSFSTRAAYGALAGIAKLSFTPQACIEYGASKELAYLDSLSQGGMYFDSTPFFFYYKVRFIDFGFAALAFGECFEWVPDQSGSAPRGFNSTTLYLIFTGISDILGVFNAGLAKTFYFSVLPDHNFIFFAAWLYAIKPLDRRLQFCLEFSNGDYRAGASEFKATGEVFFMLNAAVRGIILKKKYITISTMLAFYDLVDISEIAFNTSLGLDININLY